MLVFFVQRSPETFVTGSAYWARFEQRSGGVLGNARTESGDNGLSAAMECWPADMLTPASCAQRARLRRHGA